MAFLVVIIVPVYKHPVISSWELLHIWLQAVAVSHRPLSGSYWDSPSPDCHTCPLPIPAVHVPAKHGHKRPQFIYIRLVDENPNNQNSLTHSPKTRLKTNNWQKDNYFKDATILFYLQKSLLIRSRLKTNNWQKDNYFKDATILFYLQKSLLIRSLFRKISFVFEMPQYHKNSDKILPLLMDGLNDTANWRARTRQKAAVWSEVR